MWGEEYNSEQPLIMHIDLNSCFATVEQQSRPMLRGRPVAVVNRRTVKTSIVTASYEAKALGVSVGMKVKDALLVAPQLVVVESDPPKYRYVYHKMLGIMKRYSSHITMKSIDEGIIDFHHTSELIKGRDLKDIGYEMKQCLKDEVGSAMRCNVGISTNRFLAKTAASLHKPDGLNTIDHTNVRKTLATLRLTDLTGIAKHNEHRLNAVGIYTPLEFLDASAHTLRTMVFKSVLGEQWHQRLRGYEVDDVARETKTVGRQYVLESKHLSFAAIMRRLHHLCESVGGRLRSHNKAARGVFVYAKSYTHGYWQARHMSDLPFCSDAAIYAQAAALFVDAPSDIREIGVTCYELSENTDSQLSLFGDAAARERHVTEAIDTINKRFGDRAIHSADTLDTGIYEEVKVPFGSTRYL